MRRMDMLLPGLLLGLLLGACGGAGEPEAAPTPEQIARAICDSQGEALSLTSLEAAERGDYLAEHYDLEGVWEDAAVYTASGADGGGRRRQRTEGTDGGLPHREAGGLLRLFPRPGEAAG